MIGPIQATSCPTSRGGSSRFEYVEEERRFSLLWPLTVTVPIDTTCHKLSCCNKITGEGSP